MEAALVQDACARENSLSRGLALNERFGIASCAGAMARSHITLMERSNPTHRLDSHTPSLSQRSAIEAGCGPLLVLAGPGAGKTYCLIERIRFLIERRGFDPKRICAFTFTNKAAGEIASRLEKELGPRAEGVKGGTLHAFCAELLRELGEHIQLSPGFGIADTDYQLTVLGRLRVPPEYRKSVLTRFCGHRFNGDELKYNDGALFLKYVEHLRQRNLLDFDMLVLKAAELLQKPEVGETVRARWDCVLVDEFQDLNRSQYAIIRELSRGHRNVFAVGDDEQSIYSWAGADPAVFMAFFNDFEATRAQLGENRRCPREVVALARRLVAGNTPLFSDREHAGSERDSPFPVAAYSFPDEDDEIAWIIADLLRDRAQHGLEWGDFALLYRTNDMGSAIESAFLSGGIPCRLAQGRALSDDPVIEYVIAALRVIAFPDDEIHRECFLQVVLPRALFDDARAKAQASGQGVLQQLIESARELPKEHGDAKKIWRGWYALKNLAALGAKHSELGPLVDELLSQRVGEYRTVLEERHDELSDPADDDDIQALANRLASAVETNSAVWVPQLGGAEIALKGMLLGIGLLDVRFGKTAPGETGVVGETTPAADLPLRLFKAIQLVSSRGFTNRFRDFTAVDLETTDKDAARAEIVDIAAARVRDGKVVAEFNTLVKPNVPITAGAKEAHGISEADVAEAPAFETVWPEFRDFCGDDMVVAHNGHGFDFPVLRRMAEPLGGWTVTTYDTLPLARELQPGSRKLPDLARTYHIEPGRSHRALDDTRTLVHVFLALGEGKVARARKAARVDLLDQLGVALALSDQEVLGDEARLFRRLTPAYSLGRHSDCLDFYRAERELSGDDSLPPVDEVIERLGGESLMRRLRSERTANERYPTAMRRLRPLIEQSAGESLPEQISGFLERIALSRWEGAEPDHARANLLTLHSTKGLEFSRVYIVGVEDAQLPGGGRNGPSKREIEEARRLLYVGMTRTEDRLVLTRVDARAGKPTGGKRFLDEMGLEARKPE